MVHVPASSWFWEDSQIFQKRQGVKCYSHFQGEPSSLPKRDFYLYCSQKPAQRILEQHFLRWFPGASADLMKNLMPSKPKPVMTHCVLLLMGVCREQQLFLAVLPTGDQKPGSIQQGEVLIWGMFLGSTFCPWHPVLPSWSLKPSQGHVLRTTKPDTHPPLLSWGFSKEGQLWK